MLHEIFIPEQGIMTGSSKKVEGTVTIPNLSDENEASELDINVSTSTTGPEADVLREMMRTTGAKKIQEQLGKYIKSLKEGRCYCECDLFSQSSQTISFSRLYSGHDFTKEG